MMDIPHIGFIVAAYGVAAVAIAAMVATIWFDYRSLSAQLAALEAERPNRKGDAA